MKQIDITLGTSLKAGILCAQFNEKAEATLSKERVSIVLEDAIDLMSKKITSPLVAGWDLMVDSDWNGKRFVMDFEDAHSIGKNIHRHFIQNEDVSTFGYKDLKISIDISEESLKKLNKIQKSFNLSANFEAARLAISIFYIVKSGEAGRYHFSFAKGDKTKKLKLNA